MNITILNKTPTDEDETAIAGQAAQLEAPMSITHRSISTLEAFADRSGSNNTPFNALNRAHGCQVSCGSHFLRPTDFLCIYEMLMTLESVF